MRNGIVSKLNLCLLAGCILLLGGSTQARADQGLQKDVNEAAEVIQRFRKMPEEGIPKAVLRDAKGLAILKVLKAGFIFSGQGGWGVAIARLPKGGWSGPTAVGTGGAGFGLQVGAQVTEFVIVLNTQAAVDAFARGGNVALGADVSVAAGPVGRSIGADVMPVAAVYTYSQSQGLFAGISLEGTVIAARTEANHKYYGHPVTPRQILSGAVKPPPGAQTLIRELQAF